MSKGSKLTVEKDNETVIDSQIAARSAARYYMGCLHAHRASRPDGVKTFTGAVDPDVKAVKLGVNPLKLRLGQFIKQIE